MFNFIWQSHYKIKICVQILMFIASKKLAVEGLSRAHTSPPTLTLTLQKLIVPCGQGYD